MKLLLDTHVWLWLQTEPERLGQTLELVEDADHDLVLSVVSGWEIAIKWELGKLGLPEPPGHATCPTAWPPAASRRCR